VPSKKLDIVTMILKLHENRPLKLPIIIFFKITIFFIALFKRNDKSRYDIENKNPWKPQYRIAPTLPLKCEDSKTKEMSAYAIPPRMPNIIDFNILILMPFPNSHNREAHRLA
jgi:hypothetical protein